MNESKNIITNNNDLFNPSFNDQYELALKEGNKRFGSECKHSKVANGHCTNCLRKVVWFWSPIPGHELERIEKL